MFRKAAILISPVLLAGILALALENPPAGKAVSNAPEQARANDQLADAPPSQFDTSPIRPIPERVAVNPQKAALGKKLFHEVKLSRNQKTQCASCHELSRAGVDGKPFSTLPNGSQTQVNTPSVFNVSLFPYLYWDGAETSLENQVSRELKQHMGVEWDDAIALLKADHAYQKDFSRLYPGGISSASIINAIAEFERSLLTPNSRFDQFLKGNERAITAREKRGYQLFSRHGCVNCHQGVGVGGNMFERLGVVYPPEEESDFGRNAVFPRADAGRFKVTGKEKHRYYFRVPSLRNVEKTAPYFHDGSVDKLEDAIRIMAFYNLGTQLPERDVAEIGSFLKTLTGEYRP